ncbi:sulfotransferase family 2 domain-containing protein [Pseudoalteromonas sp. MMG012]|uniref:sulfotransferase family 2 domain-containing protein n=1 Tax=Pseudoalteromonas sp. MMG012 TaxID=2822686 RepID=UPI001B3A58EB|nr:sulfotransferase family 2 domain-containing protein [Pseudoalteromonas sp. MMG012]MBQ4849233.1 sulfotransferase family 2 domain-containing protein [Pseudoalteromonas sp. MMG012]
MISTKDNCLFVHIPKVAGQSIELFFVERMGLTWQQRSDLLLRPNEDRLMGPPRLAHLYAQEYVKYGYLSSEQFSQYFKFSFVRNPWARLVSEYTYRKALGHEQYQRSFKSFLLDAFPEPKDDDFIRGVDHYRHIVPQTNFLYDHDGNCLVDFIGQFESLQQDFSKVCKYLGINNSTLPHKNSTADLGSKNLLEKLYQKFVKLPKKPQLHYSAYYCDETIDFVSKYYAQDIKRFNYTFETQ